MKAENRYIEVLIESISLNDDYKSFELLFNLFYSKLYSFAQSYLKTPESAEEIVSDVFLKIWIKRKELLEIKNIQSYLYTATKNHALNHLSQKSNRPIHSVEKLDYHLNSQGPDPEQALLGVELEDNINKAVEALPPQCKIIYKLIREEGLSYKEVSSLLDISVKTIEAQIGIALKKIHSALRAYPVYRRKK